MWTQIAGKICLALTPRVNHFWNITMQLTPRGLPHGAIVNRRFDQHQNVRGILNMALAERGDGGSQVVRRRLVQQTVTLRRVGREQRIGKLGRGHVNPKGSTRLSLQSAR